MSSLLNKYVDGIIVQLTRFEQLIYAPAELSPKACLQLVHARIHLYTSQQLSCHLRTTHPSAALRELASLPNLLRSTTRCHMMTSASASRVLLTASVLKALSDFKLTLHSDSTGSNTTGLPFWVRSKFRVISPHRLCICAEPDDCLLIMSLAAPVSLSGTKIGLRPMPCCSINYAGTFRNTQPLSTSSPLVNYPLDRYLKSHLPVVCPAKVDEDPCRAHDSSHPARRADLALIAHSGVHLSTILIDVTIAFHNSRSADHAPLPGSVVKVWHCTYYRYPIGTYIFTTAESDPKSTYAVHLEVIWHCSAIRLWSDFLDRYIELCDS